MTRSTSPEKIALIEQYGGACTFVDDASEVYAAAERIGHLHQLTGISAGPSTGTNLWGVGQLVAQLKATGKRGSVVSLLCDSGERYACSYNDDAWLAERGLDPAPALAVLDEFLETGVWKGDGLDIRGFSGNV